MIDRRRLLGSAAAGAALIAAGPVLARSEADDRLDALLSRWFDEDVDTSPETATNLGLDRGARAHLSSRLSDRSEGAWTADRACLYAGAKPSGTAKGSLNPLINRASGVPVTAASRSA